ncbi:MAG: tetratricopeptide repeat protein [Gemmatimonadaceae bacterium]|nr:tetratricopeptide repeat protein [Gemmatimonadaceae bacterium]
MPDGSSELREVRVQAQRLADAGAWTDAGALLLAHRDGVRAYPDTAALLAESLVRTGRAREAREWLALVLPSIEVSDDRASLRRATVLNGAAHFVLGELDVARAGFNDAMELARVDGDDALVARAMNNLGAIANIEGDRTGALALYNLAISAHQRTGNTRGLAECFHNMAITYRDLGRLREADELELRSIEFGRDAGQPLIVSIARLGRAELALRRGDPTFAEATARHAAVAFAAAGDVVREAEAHRLAGLACTMSGNFAEARTLLDFAVERSQLHGAVLHQAESLRARAELAAAAGDTSAALTDARRALVLFDQLRAADECEALRRWIAATDAAAPPPASP